MTINELQNELIEEFDFITDWEEKYKYIIDMGKSLPLIDEAYKKDEFLIKGCQSRVWLHATHEDGKIYFKADSDAIITKGLVAMVVRLLSGQPAEDIVNADLYFIDKIGLKDHLSVTRSNGLLSMIKQMKLYAVALSKD